MSPTRIITGGVVLIERIEQAFASRPKRRPVKRMKRASYREGVEWIALNDENGGPEALDPEMVRSYVSVALLSDLFGVESERIAKDVIRYRKKHDV